MKDCALVCARVVALIGCGKRDVPGMCGPMREERLRADRNVDIYNYGGRGKMGSMMEESLWEW